MQLYGNIQMATDRPYAVRLRSVDKLEQGGPPLEPFILSIYEKLIVAAVLAGLYMSAHADTGNDWMAEFESQKLPKMSSVISNMKAKGCTIRFGAKYYVRQINAFFARRENRGMQVHQAFGLIATSAGEDFNCPG